MHQAHTQLVASVRHLQHVKCQHLGDCEQHSNQPDQSHLHCFPQRDTHPLHSAPWRHCMVATQTAYRYIYYWLPSLMFVMWVEKKTTYRSILRAHRLRTVIPTEAFWIKGINLQTYTPNGQSSAISCKSKIMETDGGTTLMREIKEVSPVQTHEHTSFEVHEWVLSFLSFPLSLHQLKPKATRLSSSSWLWNFIPVVIKSVQYQDTLKLCLVTLGCVTFQFSKPSQLMSAEPLLSQDKNLKYWTYESEKQAFHLNLRDSYQIWKIKLVLHIAFGLDFGSSVVVPVWGGHLATNVTLKLSLTFGLCQRWVF